MPYVYEGKKEGGGGESQQLRPIWVGKQERSTVTTFYEGGKEMAVSASIPCIGGKGEGYSNHAF